MTFVFDPESDLVAKSLQVSPFMVCFSLILLLSLIDLLLVCVID